MMVNVSEIVVLRITVLSYLVFISWFYIKTNIHPPILNRNTPSKTIQPSSSSSFESVSTIARVLYLFLCENQPEIDAYIHAFPSITADVMFLCWRENCNNTTFFTFKPFYTRKWSGQKANNHSFVQLNQTDNSILITPRVFIINEQQLNLTKKTTWTTARNLLYEAALRVEEKQGWRWSYFIFGDGDIQLGCQLPQKLLSGNGTSDDESILAQHFPSLMHMQQMLNSSMKVDQCFLLFDTFLLTVSPAMAAVNGMMIPPIVDGLLTQIVYHIDAMFNAFHRDALQFVLPYCGRYDGRTWWTSQAILVYRSLCLYGHTLQLNALAIIAQKHREYPRQGSPWAIDNDMNLVPPSLIPLQRFMGQARTVSVLILKHYGGWSLEMTGNECRNEHRYMDSITCKVGQKQNRTNS